MTAAQIRSKWDKFLHYKWILDPRSNKAHQKIINEAKKEVYKAAREYYKKIDGKPSANTMNRAKRELNLPEKRVHGRARVATPQRQKPKPKKKGTLYVKPKPKPLRRALFARKKPPPPYKKTPKKKKPRVAQKVPRQRLRPSMAPSPRRRRSIAGTPKQTPSPAIARRRRGRIALMTPSPRRRRSIAGTPKQTPSPRAAPKTPDSRIRRRALGLFAPGSPGFTPGRQPTPRVRKPAKYATPVRPARKQKITESDAMSRLRNSGSLGGDLSVAEVRRRARALMQSWNKQIDERDKIVGKYVTKRLNEDAWESKRKAVYLDKTRNRKNKRYLNAQQKQKVQRN